MQMSYGDAVRAVSTGLFMEHIPHEYQNAATLNLQRPLQVRKGRGL